MRLLQNQQELCIARNVLYSRVHPYVYIIQALVITNYRLTRSHEHHYEFHRQKLTYLALLLALLGFPMENICIQNYETFSLWDGHVFLSTALKILGALKIINNLHFQCGVHLHGVTIENSVPLRLALTLLICIIKITKKTIGHFDFKVY